MCYHVMVEHWNTRGCCILFFRLRNILAPIDIALEAARLDAPWR